MMLLCLLWLAQKQLEVFARQAAQHAVFGANDRIRKFTFRLLKLQHPLLNGIFRDQPVSENAPRLADAVRSIDGLRLHCGVPPRVQKKNIVCGREVQAESAGFQADQK